MKRRTKKLAAILTIACMTLTMLAGCGNSGSGSTDASNDAGNSNASADAAAEQETVAAVIEQVEKDESRATTETTGERFEKLVVAINADPQDLNPWNGNSGTKSYIYPYVYEKLFDYDAENYYPVLAKGYEVVDDYHWDVEIYDYIYDSAGNHITADDVLYSYQVQIDSGYAVKFEMFESIEKVDDYTVRFTWNKPIDGVCELEWVLCQIVIFSQKAYEEGDFAVSPVGTGPYTVKSFTAGSSCVLEARDDYWQTEELTERGHHANVQTLEFRVISESAQHVIGLQSGTLDFSFNVPTENLSDFAEGGQYSDRYNIYRAPSGQIQWLIGNMSGNSIWSDINFRLAVYYAMNTEAIAKVANIEAGTALCSAKYDNYYEAWSQLDNYMTNYDVELAAEYLEKSGYNGETLKLLASNEEAFKNAATMIQSLLTGIGVNVEVEIMEEAAVSACLTEPDAYDLTIGYCGGPTLIGTWNRLFNNADFADGSCIGMNADEKVPELYAAANSAEGYNMENLTALMQYVVDNAYCYVYGYPSTSYVYNNQIAELVTNYAAELRFGDCVYYMD
ncbi:MAG: ABC transporter substrate-binding protein [Eubacteriales bacterium]|nr:ABC transporter substrate-binding protein [Eubacteriales bacterium]